ncbi:hypothetical protein OROMI_006788 [Orobanche minor]
MMLEGGLSRPNTQVFLTMEEKHVELFADQETSKMLAIQGVGFGLSSLSLMSGSPLCAVIRVSIPRVKLGDAFEQKNNIAKVVEDGLEKAMYAYVYEIVQTLIVAIEPYEHVKRAMNEINAGGTEISLSLYEEADGVVTMLSLFIEKIVCDSLQKLAVELTVDFGGNVNSHPENIVWENPCPN